MQEDFDWYGSAFTVLDAFNPASVDARFPDHMRRNRHAGGYCQMPPAESTADKPG
jgi:hypothetical protein